MQPFPGGLWTSLNFGTSIIAGAPDGPMRCPFPPPGKPNATSLQKKGSRNYDVEVSVQMLAPPADRAAHIKCMQFALMQTRTRNLVLVRDAGDVPLVQFAAGSERNAVLQLRGLLPRHAKSASPPPGSAATGTKPRAENTVGDWPQQQQKSPNDTPPKPRAPLSQKTH